MEKRYDVFISYKAEEYAQASWVKSVLEENKLTCWMAPSSIPGGSSYADEIENAIKYCEVFVLILSEKAQGSMWIKKELDMALNSAKVILPFMIENCQLQKAFNFYLTDVQRYDAFSDKASAMQAMIERINSVLGNRSIAQDKPIAKNEFVEETPNGKEKHHLRVILLLFPYIAGLFLPLYLWAFNIDFTLWLRIAYFAWILFGAFWIWNRIETRPKFAALCFGTLGVKELNEHPSVVFSKIAAIFGKNVYISNDCPEGFVSYFKLKRLEFGSWDGKKTNFLKIKFKRDLEYYDPSVFYLHSLSTGKQAIQMLTRQNFIISTPPSCISPNTDFLTNGNVHVCLYYKRSALSGAIIYNCDLAEIEAHFQGEFYDEK